MQKKKIKTFLKIVIRKNINITLIKIFRPFTQYLVEASLSLITTSSLHGYYVTIFLLLDLVIFCHSSLQIFSSFVGWMGTVGGKPILRFLQKCFYWLLLGHQAIHRVVAEPLLCRLGCVLRVIIIDGCLSVVR